MELHVEYSQKENSKNTTNRSKLARQTYIEELVLEHRMSGRKLARSLLNKWNIRLGTDEINSTVDLALCEAATRFCPDRGAKYT